MMWELLLSMIYRETKINKEKKKERPRCLEEWWNWKTRDPTGGKEHRISYLANENLDQ